MNEELERKLFKIGKKILDELNLYETDLIISMKRSLLDVNSYLITVNSHQILHISDDEIKYLREHRND